MCSGHEENINKCIGSEPSKTRHSCSCTCELCKESNCNCRCENHSVSSRPGSFVFTDLENRSNKDFLPANEQSVQEEPERHEFSDGPVPVGQNVTNFNHFLDINNQAIPITDSVTLV